MPILKGAHGTIKLYANQIQKQGFKSGSEDCIWGSGVYFYSESDMKEAKKRACIWAKSRGYHSEFNSLYSPVCLLADIDYIDDYYINFEDYDDSLCEARYEIATKYETKEERNQKYKQLNEQFLNYILNKLNLKREEIVIRAPVPFPRENKEKKGYCIVVYNTDYISKPRYKEVGCI